MLRPGRLEVHMEIGLPDEKGRHQILKIKTLHMQSNNMIGPDVDLMEISLLTKNFSGAELEVCWVLLIWARSYVLKLLLLGSSS